nr:putative acetyltransferase [uncultured Mediterranean phage uvMED]
MSSIEIVPFENKHAEEILKSGLNSEALELRPEHKKYAYYLKEVGMSFTGLVNNKPIAAGGVFPLWDGVAEGWVLATKDIFNYPIFCAKHIKKRTEIIIKTNHIKRLQTSVKADCELALRFASWLGLKPEGLMKGYGPDGSDFIRYARIIK